MWMFSDHSPSKTHENRPRTALRDPPPQSVIPSSLQSAKRPPHRSKPSGTPPRAATNDRDVTGGLAPCHTHGGLVARPSPVADPSTAGREERAAPAGSSSRTLISGESPSGIVKRRLLRCVQSWRMVTVVGEPDGA